MNQPRPMAPTVTRLSHADVERARAVPGQSLLLFLTDRCPVGCGHCSVDSRPDSPSITDFALFDRLLDTIGAQPDLRVVGISGGEPFVERRGLTRAIEHLTAAEKSIALFTSGIWANEDVAAWIPPLLSKVSCVYLSTDAFHAASVNQSRFVRAAQAIAGVGAWIIVQVIDEPDMVAWATEALTAAFGPAWMDYAEFSLTVPLAYGRGAVLFPPPPPREGRRFGVCPAPASPVVRYDGVVSACCNERVIMGLGPERLRRRVDTADGLTTALHTFREDPLLQATMTTGLGALTLLPRFADLAAQRFSGICRLCWAMNERVDGAQAADDPLLRVLTLTERRERHD